MLLKQWNLKNEVKEEKEREISGESSMDAYTLCTHSVLHYVNR